MYTKDIYIRDAYTRSAWIEIHFIGNFYYVEDIWIKGDSIKSLFIQVICFCNTCIKSISGVGDMKRLKIYWQSYCISEIRLVFNTNLSLFGIS